MKAYLEVFLKLKESLLGSDFLIFGAAIFTLICMVITLLFTTTIKKRVDEWEKKKNESFTKHTLDYLRLSYTLFTTLITIFPLLGMLGTVFGLLGLDLANGDMENIKNNFFIALTSTAWGIIFSVIFKMVNAFIADDVEEQIENGKRLSSRSE